MKKITNEEMDEMRRATGGSGIDRLLKVPLRLLLVLLIIGYILFFVS